MWFLNIFSVLSGFFLAALFLGRQKRLLCLAEQERADREAEADRHAQQLAAWDALIAREAERAKELRAAMRESARLKQQSAEAQAEIDKLHADEQACLLRFRRNPLDIETVWGLLHDAKRTADYIRQRRMVDEMQRLEQLARAAELRAQLANKPLRHRPSRVLPAPAPALAAAAE